MTNTLQISQAPPVLHLKSLIWTEGYVEFELLDNEQKDTWNLSCLTMSRRTSGIWAAWQWTEGHVEFELLDNEQIQDIMVDIWE